MIPDAKRFKACESVAGVWHYHLYRIGDTPSLSLCGKSTMWCQLPVTAWGVVLEHIGERYCKECEEIAARQNELPGAKEGAA